MKILHIASKAPYNVGWGYQENLLPKYQSKMGNDVTLIVTNRTHADGATVETECADFVLEDGVRVIRVKRKEYFHRVLTSICSRLEVYSFLEELNPDFVFYHGLGGTTIFDVVRYKKKTNPSCIIVQDNHLDYNIGIRKTNIKKRLIREFERFIVRKTVSYVSCVYGVTPWRKQYAEEYYRVPPSKTDVLIMGADDEQLNIQAKKELRSIVRQKYEITDNDYLIVTGGKIDSAKNIHLLMEACLGIPRVKLLIFGNISDDVKDTFERLIQTQNQIIYIGWIPSSEVYQYYFAADLVFFPGQHSVLWEQACASKVPCVFKKWPGMDHVDVGGNCCFLDSVSKDTIREIIESLLFTPKYNHMKEIAESEATDVFLYSRIAEKSLECAIEYGSKENTK